MKRICKHDVHWKKVISRRSKQRAKKVNQASLLSVESSHNLSPKKIVEVKIKWVKVSVTMDSGAAGHVIPETMFPHVKLERKTSPERFVAANGEQIKDLGEKNNSIQDKRGNPGVQNIQKCECCQTTHFNAKRSSELETLLCWTKRIRTFETSETEQ